MLGTLLKAATKAKPETAGSEGEYLHRLAEIHCLLFAEVEAHSRNKASFPSGLSENFEILNLGDGLGSLVNRDRQDCATACCFNVTSDRGCGPSCLDDC